MINLKSWCRALMGVLFVIAFTLVVVDRAVANEAVGWSSGLIANSTTPNVPASVSSAADNLKKTTVSTSGSTAKISTIGDYRLGAGDKIRVIVFGEDDLGGEFIVDDTGLVQLPLLGQAQATGLTVHQFEEGIASRLLQLGYLTNPHVSVEVENYRPFYILGEVNKPGEYPFVTGMNLLNAIALAGGYTYRADESVIYIRRNGSSQEEKYPANESTKINPGDILRVGERFF